MVHKVIPPTAEQPTTSNIDDLMRKVEARSRKSTNWLYLAVFLILIAVVIGVIGIYKSTAVLNGLQATQQSQNDSTLEARKANVSRQLQLSDQIKCLALIRFDVKPEVLATRKGTEAALDKCAKQ